MNSLIYSGWNKLYKIRCEIKLKYFFKVSITLKVTIYRKKSREENVCVCVCVWESLIIICQANCNDLIQFLNVNKLLFQNIINGRMKK